MQSGNSQKIWTTSKKHWDSNVNVSFISGNLVSTEWNKTVSMS